MSKPAEESFKNLVQLMKLLKKESIKQKNMSKKEKEDNKLKMGDIFY